MKTLFLNIFFLLSFFYTQNIDKMVVLQSQAVQYYNEGDYGNAIILYEDLLAEQELVYGKENIRVGETLYRLGELYLLTNLPDIANYYINEATNIFQQAFQSGKNSLETPLLNLLKIYTFQNDTIKMKSIQQQLNSIATLFQFHNSYSSDYLSTNNNNILYSPDEDLALDKMNLG